MERLMSKKFVVAAATIVLMVANKQYEAAFQVALVYLGVQGATDYQDRKGGN